MKHKNWVWGLFFIFLAILIVMKQIGLLIGINVISLIITILLLPIIFKGIIKRDFFNVFFGMAIIIIVNSKLLGIDYFNVLSILGIALFLSIGFSIILPHHFNHCNKIHYDDENDDITDIPDENVVRNTTNFGSSVKYVNSNDLRKVKLNCSFGAMKVYFDNSKLSPKGAIVDLNVSFGGIELYIPKDWEVLNEVDVILGGIEEKNKNNSLSGKKVLKITGKISFSGVTIIYI